MPAFFLPSISKGYGNEETIVPVAPLFVPLCGAGPNNGQVWLF